MMERVEMRPADVRCSGLSPIDPDMEAYFAGSMKNLKHDEEKPHAAGSKTGKKRKMVLKKLKDDEKEPHAAGSKKTKKALLPDRTMEEILQVKEEPEEEKEPAWKPDPKFQEMLQVEEEPGWKSKTVTLKLTMSNLKHLEEYTPSPPYGPRILSSTNVMMINVVNRAAARHQAWLDRRNKAAQQLRDTGSAELEVELLEEDNGFAEIDKIIDNLQA